MMIGIQILGVIFALGMSYLTFHFYKRGDYSKKDFFFWMIVWVGFLVLIMFPTLAETLLNPLSVSNVMVLFTIFGFLLAFALLFYHHDLMRKNEKKLRTVVREMALNNLKKNKRGGE